MSALAAVSFLAALAIVFAVAMLLPRILRWRERRHLDTELRELLDQHDENPRK